MSIQTTILFLKRLIKFFIIFINNQISIKMKKIILLLALFFINSNIFAQKSIIKINPVSLLFGSAKATYEGVLTESSSYELSLTYNSIDVGILGKSNGLGGQVKYKIYFRDTAPEGWYVAPAVGYSSTKYSVMDVDYGINGFSLAGLIGHQWVFGDGGGFTIDINTGLGYNNWSVDGSAIIAKGDGVGLKGNLSFGWAF